MLPLLFVIAGQFAVIAYLAFQYGKDRADLLAGLLDDRAAHFGQTADLLQRIQAPKMASVAHSVAATRVLNPPALPFDDDEAYKEFKSKEQLARDLMGEL